MPARPALTASAVALAPVLPLALAAGSTGTGTTPASRPIQDRSGRWLRNAAAGLGVLAAVAAAVSFTAQYRMAQAARHLPAVAARRPRSPTPPRWSSPASASPWHCTAAAPCALAR